VDYRRDRKGTIYKLPELFKADSLSLKVIISKLVGHGAKCYRRESKSGKEVSMDDFVLKPFQP
jgi:hypothetical protein